MQTLLVSYLKAIPLTLLDSILNKLVRGPNVLGILLTNVNVIHSESINNKLMLSLGALVPNSRDQHEKQWRPDFTRHKTHPKMRFVCKKQTEVHF